MTPEDFERLQTLLASRTGYRLGRERMSLASHRLGPVARREGYDSAPELLAALWARPVASQAWAVIEALLNPETWFRRERATFDIYTRELLPALSAARGGRPVRVWSAGCSTGQEAWSLAIGAAEAGAPVEILATDLNARALDKARSGLYTGFEIQRGLSAATMLAHFDQVEDQWSVSQSLRAMVTFQRANLLEPPAPDSAAGEPRFDVIFCRHVLIDMEPGRRSAMLDALERRLVDDGCLFLGGEERLEGDSVAFRPVSGRKGLYVKTPALLRRAA